MRMLLAIAICLAIWPPILSADRLVSQFFQTNLDPAQEVPPANPAVSAAGSGSIFVNARFDDQGSPVSAYVRFSIGYEIGQPETFSGLHIHEGAAGENGPVRIGSGLSELGADTGARSIPAMEVWVDDADTLAALARMLDDPSDFYVNLHSQSSPSGLMRGQLVPVEEMFLRAVLSPNEQVPPAEGLDAVGSTSVRLLATRNPAGEIDAARVEIWTISHFREESAPAQLTSLRIHRGPPGQVGELAIDSQLSVEANTGTDPTGIAGALSILGATEGEALEAVRDMFAGRTENQFYVTVDTTAHPAGALRGQLRNTERISFDVGANSVSVVPPPMDFDAFGAARLDLFATRDAEGRIDSATVQFNVNVEFPPGPHSFTTMHVHRGMAGEAGPIALDSLLGFFGPGPTIDGANGRVANFTTIGPSFPAAVEVLNEMVAGPDAFYLDLHTQSHPAGAIRGQLSNTLATVPAVNAGGAINAALDPAIAVASPRGLMSIFGSNVAAMTMSATPDAEGKLPNTLGGTGVWIGGLPASVLFTSPTQLNVQVPGLAPGVYSASLSTAGGMSDPFELTVGAVSPGIFVITKTDYSIVSESNPVSPGDVIIIWTTGLGASSPPVPAGELAPADPVAQPTAAVQVMFGETLGTVVGVALSPGLAGVEQVAATVPDVSGAVDVSISTSGTTSNAEPIEVVE